MNLLYLFLFPFFWHLSKIFFIFIIVIIYLFYNKLINITFWLLLLFVFETNACYFTSHIRILLDNIMNVFLILLIMFHEYYILFQNLNFLLFNHLFFFLLHFIYYSLLHVYFPLLHIFVLLLHIYLKILCLKQFPHHQN